MPLLVTITTIVNIDTLLNKKEGLPPFHSTRAAMRTETKLAKQCINGRIMKTDSHMTFYFEQVTYAYSLIGEGKALGLPVPER